MCIICFSPKGKPLPSQDRIMTMFARNPHGAGIMVARGDTVECHKGFMNIEDFLRCVENMNITDDDAVGMHFRISTQAGVNPSMTHPFPLSHRLNEMTYLDYTCGCGVMHNGIIRLTSNGDKRYSDTALYITKYLADIISSAADFTPDNGKYIKAMTNSRLLLLDGKGNHLLVGDWITGDDGNLYSNSTYKPYVPPVYKPSRHAYGVDQYGGVVWDDDDDDDGYWWDDYKNWWKKNLKEPTKKH